MIAVCPGSFDPITNGHLNIIRRTAKLFDRVVVLVSTNPSKQVSFTTDERVDLIRRSVEGIGNIVVDSSDGLLADYAKQHGIRAIVKGLRAVSDFEYEFQMALANKKIDDELETVFLTCSAENMFLSSSLVKQLASFRADISDFIPPAILKDVEDRLFPAEK
ncbi:pantetheine-phosphate adenylyltransferase [Candidatus Soleaferrea massiliensis]|uniref:pantetheine-phosphate adenylyltransferase n=1 Tax=Candidatus Soleaferrea massiliensis TaxID=1470354 RepID=UPI00058AD333|nr:pantetheine-phosphate adenylyltransferase [Candidatus Soleaferrea massiliensis]